LILRVAVGVVALAALTACGGGGDGPLFQSTARMRVCTPSSPGGDLTVGDDILRNLGGHDVVLDAIRLVEPVGIEIVEARLLEIGGGPLVGVFSSPPPSIVGRQEWERGSVLAEATVGPGETMNLVLWLRRDGSERAGFRTVEVTYRSAGRSHRWRSIREFITMQDCSTRDQNG
jgi:hypothetical protein